MNGELRLMSVHAHADDESITMGGLLAISHDRGIRTANVCCTDGKLATIVAEDMPEETTRPRLAEIRQQELRAACAILGVDEVHFLGYGDSGMWGADTNQLPDAFWKADINEAVGRMVARIRRFRPHVVVTYDGVGGYGHPDHIQTHRVTLLAVEAAHMKSLYPEAGEPWRIAHHSQIAPDWPMLAIPEEVNIEHFGNESFQLVISRVPVSLPETDVFAGIVAHEAVPV